MSKFKPYRHRIQNIEVRNCHSFNGKVEPIQSHLSIPPFSFFNIVKYYPNEYYGKESDYKWDESGEFAVVGESIRIYKSCFVNPETTYAIASWGNVSIDKEYAELKFCGNAPFELSDTERKIFWKLAAIGQEYIQSLMEEEG